MNGKLLKAKMVECDISVNEIAKACEISVNSCYRKIRGESQFLPSEISAVTNTLHLTPKEFFYVFFPDLIKSKAVSGGLYNGGNFTLLVNSDGSPMLWED